MKYLPLNQAAEMIGVSPETFEAEAEGYGILGFTMMGAKVYRLADIEGRLDELWRRSTKEADHGICNTQKPYQTARKSSVEQALERVPRPKPRQRSRDMSEPEYPPPALSFSIGR